MTIRKVQRHGETRLVVDITYKKKDGTNGRYRHDAEVQTMPAARAEERRILTNIAMYGEPHEPSSKIDPPKSLEVQLSGKSFAEVVDLFRAGKAKTKLKPTTRAGYEEILTTRLLPRFGQGSVEAINFGSVTGLDASMVEEGLSPSRRRNVAICLRSILGSAVDAGILPALPKMPKLPKVGGKVLRCLSTEQVEKVLAVSSPAARLAFAIAAYAGLRLGEVRALRWCDVDLRAGILVVRFSTSKGSTSTPKSGHEREVPIASALRILLEGARPGTGKALVALTSLGKPWGAFGLLVALQRAQARVGLSGWRFHDLRHYFITAAFRRGGSAPAIQALAGHANLATTQRYAHASEQDLRRAVG